MHLTPVCQQFIYPRIPPQHLTNTVLAAFSVAGVDTSAVTFGFMLWELSRRPDVVQRLRDELDEVIPDRRTIPDHRVLGEQPYLSAFLNEGTLPRRAPTAAAYP